MIKFKFASSSLRLMEATFYLFIFLLYFIYENYLNTME